MGLAPAYDKKYLVHPLVLKPDVTLGQRLRLTIFYFFARNSFSSDQHLYFDVIHRQRMPDMVCLTHTKTFAKFILHSIILYL